MTVGFWVSLLLVVGAWLTMIYTDEVRDYGLFVSALLVGIASYVWNLEERE